MIPAAFLATGLWFAGRILLTIRSLEVRTGNETVDLGWGSLHLNFHATFGTALVLFVGFAIPAVGLFFVVRAQTRTRVERDQAKATVDAQALQYQVLFEGNPNPMWVFDRNSLRFMAVNDAAVRHYGYSREEFLSMTIKEIRPPGEIPRLLEDLSQDQVGIDFAGVWSHRKKDGTVIAVEITSNQVTFAGQTAVLALARDVTERRQAAEALRVAHERLRAIFDAAPVAIYTLDRGMMVQSWNPAAERIFGWGPSEVIGQPLPTVDKAEKKAAEHLADTVLRGQAVTGIEATRRRRDGTAVFIRAYAAPLHDRDGEITGIMVMAADSTELRRIEQQYRQAQKMESVGRLAGGIAHDFNNLLTVIMGNTQMVLQELSEDHPGRPDLLESFKASERAAGLTRQLLAFSRQQLFASTVFALNDLVSDLDKMLRRMIGEDIDLITHPAPNAGRVHADRGQIEQVLMNLVVNARDAMPEGGRLTIETAKVTLDEAYVTSHLGVTPGDYVLLAVTDTGTGMTEEVKARIFEPFFTTKDVGKGTGLGLATVFGIVKQSGGHVAAYSEAGQGTTFKVYLPRVELGTSEPAAAETTGLPRGDETILVVEDEAAVRTLTRRALEAQGYVVLTAENGAAGLRMAQEHEKPIHLLVTDVVMPDMSGPELARQIAIRWPEMKVIFVSGYPGEAIAHRGVLEPGVPFVQKPFAIRDLAQKVREVLDGSAR